MRLTEAGTRVNLIDPLLRTALWNLADHTQVGIEIPVHGYDPTPWQGITDYCLYDESGNVLAIVEAKKSSRDAREKAEAELAELEARIAPLQKEADRLTRQFWVTKDQVKKNNYELTASRYRQLDHDDTYFEKPETTLDRLDVLNARAADVASAIRKALKP